MKPFIPPANDSSGKRKPTNVKDQYFFMTMYLVFQSYKRIILFAAICFICFSFPLKAQNCNSLIVDFSIKGFGDRASNVVLNSGTTYQFKNLSCGLCQNNAYTWTIIPIGVASTGYILSSYTAVSPSVTFSAPGVYSVNLKVISSKSSEAWSCSPQEKDSTKSAYITVKDRVPVTQFASNGSVVSALAIVPNNIVNFNDASSNMPASWAWTITPDTGWSFTSGSASSQNPSVRFTSNGVYSVALKASNSAGNNTISKSSHITVTTIKPVADFNANGIVPEQLSVLQGSKVNFYDQSTNTPTSWSWNISPASGWSFSSGADTSQNPSVDFNSVGNYSVTLTAANGAGNHVKTRYSYINVTPLNPPIANFAANGFADWPFALERGGSVVFKNSSTNSPASFAWSISPASGWTFVPGSNASSENPRVIFNTHGLFTVTLIVTNQFGSDTLTKSDLIAVSTPGNPAPPPYEHWNCRVKGAFAGLPANLIKTSDGGFLMGGGADTWLDGDPGYTSPGEGDYWIVKTDERGNKIWERFYGGLAGDGLISMQQTLDGGYILGGVSASGAGGDKTEESRGSTDYWIIKIDSAGEKQWDKCFGGSDFESLKTVIQTSDAGYVLSGVSNSPVSGDKTQDAWGRVDVHGSITPLDYWVVKIDAAGNKQWDKRFGSDKHDDGCMIIETSDGGYLVGGSSQGDISGDKTQGSWDLESPPNRFRPFDYWLVKMDVHGNKQWDRRFGSGYTGFDTGEEILNAILQAANGDYLIAGRSQSQISADKTDYGKGSFDYWVLRIDTAGNKLWDKCFGGLGYDEPMAIKALNDGGFLLAGNSSSGVGGDKTEVSKGEWLDMWVLKIDSSGVKQWDKTLGTNETELLAGIETMGDDQIFIVAVTRGNPIDKPGPYFPSDFLLAKIGDANPAIITSFSPTTGLPGDSITIQGTNFSNPTTIRFSGVDAIVEAVDSVTVKAVVPFGAVTGLITAGNYIGYANSKDTFFIAGPRIYSFSPDSASAGAMLTLSGANFQGTHGVYFAGAEAKAFSIDSSSQITVTVPAKARSGTITVLANAGKDTSSSHFYFIQNSGDTIEICPGASFSITSSKAGAGYWQMNNGSGFYSSILYDNANLSGGRTTTLVFKNIPSTWSGYKFRYRTNTFEYSDTTTLRFANYWNWLNGTDSQFGNNANWGCLQVPDSNTDVIIEKGNINLHSIQTVRSIELKPGAGLNVLGGGQLKLTGRKP